MWSTSNHLIQSLLMGYSIKCSVYNVQVLYDQAVVIPVFQPGSVLYHFDICKEIVLCLVLVL